MAFSFKELLKGYKKPKKGSAKNGDKSSSSGGADGGAATEATPAELGAFPASVHKLWARRRRGWEPTPPLTPPWPPPPTSDGGGGKLAICLTVVDALPHEELWQRWLKGANSDLLKRSGCLHVHAKFPDKLAASQPWASSRCLEHSFVPEWNDIKVPILVHLRAEFQIIGCFLNSLGMQIIKSSSDLEEVELHARTKPLWSSRMLLLLYLAIPGPMRRLRFNLFFYLARTAGGAGYGRVADCSARGPCRAVHLPGHRVVRAVPQFSRDGGRALGERPEIVAGHVGRRPTRRVLFNAIPFYMMCPSLIRRASFVLPLFVSTFLPYEIISVAIYIRT